MTRDEILKMPAGRELDALIDKHIMTNEPPGFWLWSEDIAAAWLVVSKLFELSGGTVEFRQHSFLFCVKLLGWDKWLCADTAPLAICRAALIAKEADK